MHAAVDSLGLLLALLVIPVSADERTQVEALATQGQEVTGEHVEANTAGAHGMHLEVAKLPETKRGFVLLPRRWVVERHFAWRARFRRLARDYERQPAVLAGCTSSPSRVFCFAGLSR